MFAKRRTEIIKQSILQPFISATCKLQQFAPTKAHAVPNWFTEGVSQTGWTSLMSHAFLNFVETASA